MMIIDHDNDNDGNDDNDDNDNDVNDDNDDNAQVLRGLQPEEGFPRAWWEVASYLLC